MPTRRPLTLPVLIASLVLAGHVPAAFAGGGPDFAEVTCPVCTTKHAVHAGGSCFVARADPEDLFNQLPWSAQSIHTCPHCLYSALAGEFATLPPADRIGVRRALDDLPIALPELARDLLGIDAAELLGPWPAPGRLPIWSLEHRPLRFLLAELCSRARGDDPERRLLLRRYLHHTAWRAPRIEAASRALLLAELPQAPVPDDLAYLYFLRGELERRGGDRESALGWFEKAERLVRDDPRQQVLAGWCRDQAFRSRAPELNTADLADVLDAAAPLDRGERRARTAVRELADRTDAEAWSALVGYMNRSEAHLDHVAGVLELGVLIRMGDETAIEAPLLRLCRGLEPAAGAEPLRDLEPARLQQLGASLENNGFRKFEATRAELGARLRESLPAWLSKPLLEAVAVTVAEPVEALAQRHGLHACRLRRLNPELAEAPELNTGQTVLLPRFPEGWDPPANQFQDREYWLLSALDGLLREGDPDAATAFGRWITEAGTADLRGVDQCVLALRGRPELWEPLRRGGGEPSSSERDRLWRCALFACGDDAQGPKLLPLLDPDRVWGGVEDILLQELARRGDRAALPAVLANTRKGMNWAVSRSVPAYVGAVAGESDLPALESAIRRLPRGRHDGFLRADLEAIVRLIRLRLAVERGVL